MNHLARAHVLVGHTAPGRRMATSVLGACLILRCAVAPALSPAAALLPDESFRHHVEQFNRDDDELYQNDIPNAAAWEFLRSNIPLFECPDEDIERTYYFRWWTFRKHLKHTPDGWVITEFLPKVPWSGKHNTISCPAGHHFYEGRWLRDPRFLNQYAKFWFREGGNPRSYSFWAADALWASFLVQHEAGPVVELLDDLVENYRAWEDSRLATDGLFWQIDDRDGMEVSVGKSGKRATINSYMYGDARAIARIAGLAGKRQLAEEYEAKAARLRRLVQEKLWDDSAKFFKTLPRSEHELVTPKHSADGSVPSHHWREKGHEGTLEWLQYDFPAPIRADAAEVYWHRDGGGVDLPQSWRVLHRQGREWKPVENAAPYGIEPDAYNHVGFPAVETDALRLEVQSRPAKAAGLYEWRVLRDGANFAVHATASASVVRTSRRFGNTLRTLNDGEDKCREAALVDVRELHGFTPWYFHLPEDGKGYEAAWAQLTNDAGFRAPFGPTTAERRHPGFTISYVGHGCQWNGPSWPFATAVTLTALANLLNDYRQDAVGRTEYLEALQTYTHSHRRTLPDGRMVSWIDENLDPFTGQWIARTRCEEHNARLMERGQEDKVLRERGKDYNHSTYCDLVITGLVGLRPRADDVVEVNPLLPAGTWDYFCLDNVAYHGRILTVVWDKSGDRYRKGKGLRVLADGTEIARSDELERLSAPLAPREPVE